MEERSLKTKAESASLYLMVFGVICSIYGYFGSHPIPFYIGQGLVLIGSLTQCGIHFHSSYKNHQNPSWSFVALFGIAGITAFVNILTITKV